MRAGKEAYKTDAPSTDSKGRLADLSADYRCSSVQDEMVSLSLSWKTEQGLDLIEPTADKEVAGPQAHTRNLFYKGPAIRDKMRD